jgi:serine phosphatase RsbU (regulator of sigma subunit)
MSDKVLQEKTLATRLFDRLTFQINSFQEGFEILSRSRNLTELGKNFCHILRGSLLTTYVNLYFRPSESTKFTVVHEQRKNIRPDLEQYLADKSFRYMSVDEGNFLIAFVPRKDGSIFIIQVGPGLKKQEFSEYEMMSLQLFIQLLDNACQTLSLRSAEKDLIFSLNHRLLQMNNLIDTGIELSKTFGEEDLFSLMLMRAVSMTNASRGRLTIREGNKVLRRLFFPDNAQKSYQQHGHSPDLTLEGNFKFQKKKYVLDLQEKESRKGVVPFDVTDKLLINALMRQAHAAIESEYLQCQAVEMEKVRRDLALAATIQQRILPESLPQIKGYDLAGINIPAIEVCGDYYDCLPVAKNKVALIMADVSGKGIPAALLVSTLQASLRVYLENNMILTELVERLNKLIYRSTTAEKYLTMCICFLNTETGEIEALNAGHNPPMIARKDKTLTKITIGGIPIGMADLDLAYKKQDFKIEPGESLLFFTDGITEAMNSREELYEDRRLESFLIDSLDKPAQQFVADLIADVNQFVGQAEQSDDITVLYLRREL